jgi:two-component system sensor kinase FixL
LGTRTALFTGYLRDLTQQHEAKKELEAARLQLARSEKLTAVGQLVSGVAHEVRTPLTYLNTNLHLLHGRLERIRAKLPESQQGELDGVRERMADVLEAADRIDRLVEDLRRYSKLKAGAQKEGPLQEAVREAVSLFAATHRPDVEVRADLEAPPAIRMDRVQIQQIVLNLLQNAAEAMPTGGTILVQTRAQAGRALLVVEDEGRGIPPEIRDRVFDPFFTTKTEGTGLGLSIVKRLVEEHRGAIRIEAAAPRGTRFEIVFPAASEPHAVPIRDVAPALARVP